MQRHNNNYLENDIQVSNLFIVHKTYNNKIPNYGTNTINNICTIYADYKDKYVYLAYMKGI